MKEIFFKATNKKSTSCWDYRQIKKRWDLDIDQMKYSDDVIIIPLIDIKTWEKLDISSIHIDCNKKTGEFRLFYELKNNEQ